MMIPKYKEVTFADLTNIEIVPGNIILVKDTFEYYYDTSESKRISIGSSIITINTEAEKDTISPINNKLYFVIDSATMYVYTNDNWKNISVKIKTFVIEVLSSDWSIDSDHVELYRITIQHNLNNQAVIPIVYNSLLEDQFVSSKILDNNDVLLRNNEAIDCKIVIR